jgi:O-antigen ligase
MTRALNDVADPDTRLTATTASAWLVPAVFGALPTLGLIAGPSYAGLIFGLGLLQAAIGVGTQHRVPALDRDLGLIALAFSALCWASIGWSIDAQHSLHAALEMTAIFVGALVFLAGPTPGARGVERLFRMLLLASVLGAAALSVDWALGYPLQRLAMGPPRAEVATKYNRGIDYFVLIAWPQLGYAAVRGSRRELIALGASFAVIVALGSSLAGRVGALTGGLVLAIALWRRRLISAALTGGIAAFAAGLPFLLRLLTRHRDALSGYLKPSGLDRLEIWDHMSARVLERPLLGWGFAVAGKTPISATELSHYVIEHGRDTYPHDQWLQLWVETGAVGVAIGLVFAVVVLWRIRRLDGALQPFAYAVFASAVTIAAVNFEVTTDSWWAALCASGYLLTAGDARLRLSMTRP